MGKRVLGIDENGLGPVMGPLVVTGTLLRQSGSGWFEDIADSKSFFPSRSANNFSKIEEAAISIFYLWKKKYPGSPAEILDAFCGKTGCLSGAEICGGRIPESFIWADAEKAKRRSEAFAQWAGKNGVEMEEIRSFSLCPRRINDSLEKGATKLLLDFLTFCSIVKHVPEKNLLEVQAGKIGGLKFYRNHLLYSFPGFSTATLAEKEELSSYSLENGRTSFKIHFIMDVEQKSFPAALSSISGKYIREIIMEGIRKTLGIKENISGYHDGKTRKVIASLDFEKFPVGCILRKK
ncbi:MAG: hypothetical protein JW957_04635 [Candidatus Omnitrophica bacterium]|nr:hypothetical protein [Candidatus Omnitrophota bacterium]